MLVLVGVHIVAERIGSGPEFRLETELRSGLAIVGLFFRHWDFNLTAFSIWAAL